MKTLTSNIISIDALSSEMIDAMFQLYNQYYAGTYFQLFREDLFRKNWVIVLYDPYMNLAGFSTLALFDHYDGKEAYRVLFSGDTIIDHQFWGQHELATAWIQFSGKIKAEKPSLPLYWLLIVKGYRTYRYLSAFCHKYYPGFDQEVPTSIQALMDGLAYGRFGSAYCASTGLVSFAESHGHLREGWADIPHKVKNRNEVKYFLQRNPHFERGDELVCLCELTEQNLKPFAKRIFVKSYQEAEEIFNE